VGKWIVILWFLLGDFSLAQADGVVEAVVIACGHDGGTRWAADTNQPWAQLDFDQFELHASLDVKTIQALYYKSGRDRLLTIVLVRDLEGKRLDQMFYCTKLEWTARQVLFPAIIQSLA